VGTHLPTLFRHKGFRYFFFSNEGREPIHIHIQKDDKYAKFWIEPIALAYNYKFNIKELNQIQKIVEHKMLLIKEKWNEYFTGPGIKGN
jgi:hypothetical protein